MISALHLVHPVSTDKLSVETGPPSTTSFTFATNFMSICWPCRSTWVLLRNLTYDRPSEKGRAEKLQWYVLSSLKGIQSRNCHCSEDIFILAEITRGNPFSSTRLPVTDRWLSGSLGWSEQAAVQESQASQAWDRDSSLGRHCCQQAFITLGNPHACIPPRLFQPDPWVCPPGHRDWVCVLGGSFTSMIGEVMAGSHK